MPVIAQSLSRISTELPEIFPSASLPESYNFENPLVVISNTSKHADGRDPIFLGLSKEHLGDVKKGKVLKRVKIAFLKVFSKLQRRCNSRLDSSRIQSGRSVSNAYSRFERGLEEILPVISGHNRKY